jgi:hypothetical protein
VSDPLEVFLSGADQARSITQRCSDITVRSTAPGGYASVQLSLNQPLATSDVPLFNTVVVSDRRTAEIVGAGRVEDPGRAASDSGEVWSITALGWGPAHVEDVTLPYISIDGSMDSFVRGGNIQAPGATAALGNDPGADGTQQAMVFQFPQGEAIGDGSSARMDYRRIVEANQLLGGFHYTWDAGITNGNFSVDALCDTGEPSGGGDIGATNTLNVAGGTIAAKSAGGGAFGTNRDTLRLRLRKNAGGALTVANDDTWASVTALRVSAMRYDKTGTLINGAGTYTNDYVLASEVVQDLLGWMLPKFDGANATITATSHQLDQLAYPDPVTPGQILDDLMDYEDGYYWAVWEQQANGKWRFEWVAWPTSVGYEADAVDGFNAPGAATDIYSAVTVRWKDPRGRIRSTLRSQVVPVLADAGLSRTGYLDLADETGSSTNAQRAGDRFLAQHAAAPNVATLTVARPIKDLVNGRWVPPWRILPGRLIRVRGVRPRVDALNATDHDGSTVFRIVSVEYSTSTGAATLELDAYTRTEARAIANLHRRRNRKR